MDRHQRLSTRFFLLGLGLVCLIVYTLLIAAIAFIRGQVLNHWIFPIAVMLTGITQYFAARALFPDKPVKVFFQGLLILLFIGAGSIWAAGKIYDVSFDGQWYHQETIQKLKSGWNPYVRYLDAPELKIPPGDKMVYCSGPDLNPDTGWVTLPNLKYLSINHFPKSIEIVQASVYSLTGRLETGKAVNVFAWLGALFLCLAWLYRQLNISVGKKWALALLAACNPVTLAQLPTYCVDGTLAALFLSLIACLLLISESTGHYRLFLYGLLLIICLNIKLSVLLYLAFLTGGFLLYFFIRKDFVKMKKLIYASLLSGAIGLLFIGFHPYITNFISKGTPFYSLGDTQNEIVEITPPYLIGKNRLVKFSVSLLSRSYNEAADADNLKEIIKVPFTVNKKELQNANEAETKLAAFGPFYGGAWLISIGLLIWGGFRFRRERAFSRGLFFFGLILLSVLAMPEPFWGRFIFHMWLMPVVVLAMMEWLPSAPARWWRMILYSAMTLNVAWAALGFGYNLLISAHVDYQVAQLRALNEPVILEYCPYRDFKGNELRLQENGISYTEGKVTGRYIANLVHSNTRIETEHPLPDLPKPLLMRWSEKLRGGSAD